jgi:hypothetical protein
MSTPTEPGIYWASSTTNATHYDKIVEIVGHAPFFRVRAWPHFDDFYPHEYDTTYMLFGPKVEFPPVKP